MLCYNESTKHSTGELSTKYYAFIDVFQIVLRLQKKDKTLARQNKMSKVGKVQILTK